MLKKWISCLLIVAWHDEHQMQNMEEGIKVRRRSISCVLLVAFFFGLISPVAFAEPVEVYWGSAKLDDTQITYYQRNQYSGVWSAAEPDDYSGKYDPSTHTLYLYNYSTYGENTSYLTTDSSAALYSTGDLNIVIEGTNYITDSFYKKQNTYGVVVDGNLSVSGSGSLTVRPFESTFNDTPESFVLGCGVLVGGNLIVDGVSFFGRGGNTNCIFDSTFGIKTTGSIEVINSGSIKGEARSKMPSNGTNAVSYGIFAGAVSLGAETKLDVSAYTADTCAGLNVEPQFVDCDAYLFGRGNPVKVSSLDESDLYYSSNSVYLEMDNGESGNDDPNVVYSASCGDSASFLLYNDGRLIISGSGRINDSSFHTSFYMSQVKSIVINEGISQLGNRAFQGLSLLTSVSFPSTLKTIGNTCFQACGNLQNVEFPDGLESIGANAFSYCNALTDITIPASVTTVGSTENGGGTFSHCDALESFSVCGDDVLLWAGMLSNCPVLERVILSSGCHFVEAMDRSGTIFGENPKLKTVGPTGSGCNVEYAWTTNIPARAFVGLNKSMTTAYIPETVTTIGWEAFYGCYELRDIYFDGTEDEWSNIEIADYNNSLYWQSTTYHFKENCYHQWGPVSSHDAQGHYMECAICHRISWGTSTEHDFGAWFVSTQPTPAVIGKISRVCKDCGYVETQNYGWGDRIVEDNVVDIVRNVVNGIVDDIVAGADTYAVDATTAENIRAAYENGYIISATPFFRETTESHIPWLDRSLIYEFLKKNFGLNIKLGQYLDMSIAMTADKGNGEIEVLGNVKVCRNSIDYTYAIPPSLWRPGRTYYIVCDHDNIVSTLPVTNNGDGTISFSMSGFSTYALVYEDADVWDGISLVQPTSTTTIDSTEYYQIGNAAELAFVAKEGGAWLSRNYILTDDIFLNAESPSWDEDGNCTNAASLTKWTPIGTNDAPFTGTFLGNGHSVIGMYAASENATDVGLFGKITGSLIDGLTIKDAYVLNSSDGFSMAGVFAGEISDRRGSKNTIQDCRVDCCAVKAYRAGGFAGAIGGGADYLVKNCKADVDVFGLQGSNVYIGGFFGDAACHAINCYVAGTVHGYRTVGGFTGWQEVSSTSFINCFSACDVSGEEKNGVLHIGGFIGENTYNVNLTNCFWLKTAGINDTLSETAGTGFAVDAEGRLITASGIFPNDYAQDALNGWVASQAEKDYCIWLNGGSLELSNVVADYSVSGRLTLKARGEYQPVLAAVYSEEGQMKTVAFFDNSLVTIPSSNTQTYRYKLFVLSDDWTPMSPAKTF